MVCTLSNDAVVPAVADDSPFSLGNVSAYRQWRSWKLAQYPASIEALMVEIADPSQLLPQETGALLAGLRRTNMVLYSLKDGAVADKESVRALGRQLGLERLDNNLGADEDSITSLRVVEGDRRTGYIPYTNRRLSWHTDGYYNAPNCQIRGVVMHCARHAESGGANALVDHEMIYIRMRDANPAYIAALMEPDVMTIPPNREGGEEIRGAQAGPVFSVDEKTGVLHMRYSARTRNIEWRQDATTQAAVNLLTELMCEGAPHVFTYRLSSGEGIICNNVLHCRTAFEDNDGTGQGRLLYRARYYDRVNGTAMADIDWQVGNYVESQ